MKLPHINDLAFKENFSSKKVRNKHLVKGLHCCEAGHTGRAKARNVFGRLNTEIVGSNPNRGMDVCLRFSLFVSCVGSGLATG
jgi:hypothetical protein